MDDITRLEDKHFFYLSFGPWEPFVHSKICFDIQNFKYWKNCRMKFVQRNFLAEENLNMSEQLANLSIFCNFFQRCNIFCVC